MAELSGDAMDAARKREEALMVRNQSASSTDGQLESTLHSAYQARSQLGSRLDAIERALDEGVSRAGNLKSPAAKRAFQQFLLDKHNQIIKVVEDGKQSSSVLASQLAGVGGLYQPASSSDDWEHDEPWLPPAHDPANDKAGPGPGAGPRIPDSVIKPVSSSDDWEHDEPWLPPAHDPANDKAGPGPGAGPRIPDWVIKPASFDTPIKADGDPSVPPLQDSTHHNGQFAPPPPAAPVPDMPPRATGPLQPTATDGGGSQGIGMSSLSVDPTHRNPGPPAPITTADGAGRVSGGDPHGSLGMGPGVADGSHTPAGAGPIYRDPRELGPAGMAEQIPHSGVWVRPDQVDHNVFTVPPHAVAPSNAVYVGKAPNGDDIWRYADPGPR
ncbi:DUF4226 domain-containing protein [Mycolicibacterium llatzerense]|uniref:DUF4226 domain-containing protein n=1 Tax=Mycolicibacterium llatzerense TaxID=280871 RepID=UPI0021B62007|nr:DUF4226 domain-containing protein [Mycolicibacterium llatzerense]MCT7371900.1 hypothetical protein [Mycolicibacterium llatzerense]